MFGNGLQPGLWRDFQARFGVKMIGEFYGATEGNCNIINTDNTIGACGFTSMIAPFMYPVTLIKVDEDNNIMRDRNGVCVRTKPGELGELVGKIVAGEPLRKFDGYASKEATDKKVAMNVFKKGDMAFLTVTHKLKKTTLQAEGSNPHKTEDRLFYMNNKIGQYKPLTLDSVFLYFKPNF
ncbi:hypothetical protein DPMN_156531 [Dreissena polymorpha]|uniref:AMP-dependent synthetase/ligase domain-containing protein n=1 Tax=Dreissena polymorpha TaxID=45954 RepID=A0A9D4FTR0_DREPO|nr:hypothetical protein DPMN_156531 [Dreissena polymorpha]